MWSGVELNVEVSDEDYPLLQRRFNGDREEIISATEEYLHRCAETQRGAEAFEAAKAAGQIFVARYWQHGSEETWEFRTPQEAADFLKGGEDYDTLEAIGVFDPDGNDMGWDYIKGWTKGEPAA